MPVIAPFERIAMDKGIQTGSLSEAKVSLLDNLDERFGNIPEFIKEKVESMDEITIIRHLRRQALKVDSIEQFQHRIDESLKSFDNSSD